MKKKHLEIILDNLKPYPRPKPHLEQYTIEGKLASEILFFAKDDIVDNFVIDLGCGTGKLAIGAKLLGAKKALGIDIDEETIETAKENVELVKNKVEDFATSSDDLDIVFLKMDVRDIDRSFLEENSNLKKVVIQNPPFGAQKKYADRVFLDKALEIGDVIYTIHNTPTRDFIINYVKEKGRIITNIFQASFRVPKIYDFHKKKSSDIPVDIYRIE